MLDIFLEIARTLVMSVIFGFLLVIGRRHDLHEQRGWYFIVTGFGLLSFGSLLDITDNFESLNHFVVIGDTGVEAVLEKVVGYLLGFILLFVGFWYWLPLVGALRAVEQKLSAYSVGLEAQVKARTTAFETANEELRQEIADRKQAEEALRTSEERFRDFAGSASDWFWETGPELRFTYISERFFEITGVPTEAVIGKTRMEFVDPKVVAMDPDKWRQHEEDLAKHKPIRDFDYLVKEGSDRRTYISISGTPVFDTSGAFRGYRGTGTDITKLKRAEEEIKHLANHDALTGLPSLRLGKDRLSVAIAVARRNKTMVALMFADLDGFKAVNDTLGHEAGDHVLKETAGRLTTCVREADTVARVGGDEFTIVLTDVRGKTGAATVAEKMIDSLCQPFRYDDHDASIGVSIGIVLYPDHEESPEELIKQADAAMYAAKRTGKNNYRFATSERSAKSISDVGGETLLTEGDSEN